jgi:hypothetical protein
MKDICFYEYSVLKNKFWHYFFSKICGFEVSTTPALNLPPVSTAPVVHLEL